MLNSNEVSQAAMSSDMLTIFDYVTQGTSDDIELDYVMPNNVELNFD